MAFVNEHIPEEYIKKYEIEKWDRKYYKAHYKPEWTVDYENESYLRYIRSGHEEDANRWFFHFHWRNADFSVQVVLLDGHEDSKTNPRRRYELKDLSIPFSNSPLSELDCMRQEILTSLKNALIAYGDAGMHSIANNLFVSFEF